MSRDLSCFLYTDISRKVVGKKLHATIPKGNMWYDQYTVPNTVAIEPTFVAFLISTRKHTAMASLAIVSNFFLFPKKSELKTTHTTFQDCRVHFFRIAVNYNWDELLDLDIYLSFHTSTRTGAVQLLESWTKVLRHIYICESFCQFTLTHPLPPPPPPAKPTSNVGRLHPEFFPEFQHCIGGGRENCKKISKRMHCFIRASIDYGELWTLQWHVPRTFVQNFRSF